MGEIRLHPLADLLLCKMSGNGLLTRRRVDQRIDDDDLLAQRGQHRRALDLPEHIVGYGIDRLLERLVRLCRGLGAGCAATCQSKHCSHVQRKDKARHGDSHLHSFLT